MRRKAKPKTKPKKEKELTRETCRRMLVNRDITEWMDENPGVIYKHKQKMPKWLKGESVKEKKIRKGKKTKK